MKIQNQSSAMASNDQISKKNDGNNNFDKSQVVVVMVPFPAQGHLNQLLHLSCLILSRNLPIHYVGTATHIRQAKHRVQGRDLNSIISNIHFHEFEVPPFVSPPPNPNNLETKFPFHMLPSFEITSHLSKPLASLLQSLSCSSKRVIVIHDSLMASVAQDAKNVANVENYTFHSTSAFNTFLFLWEEIGRPQIESFSIPEIPSFEGCFTTQFLDSIIAESEFLKFNDGNIYNTSRAIEKPYIELIESISGGKKTWALGPFNPLAIEKKDLDSNSKGEKTHFVIEWLDKQQAKSVIYVSFGSTTTLTGEEIEQIAIGLEQSKQKFIWVLRDADKGNIFDGNEAKRHELPNGFQERVKEGKGLVVRDWAPQLKILSHPSIGGFMSHCGWNSCIESLTMGVPIAAWPMHSDQPRNRVLITEVLKVGLVVRDWNKRDELVSASIIENAVRKLMETKEGIEMRERAMKLRNDILRSMDEGGVSRLEMDSFIAHITR